MGKETDPVIIFGAGPAGLSSAKELAGRGAQVTLVAPERSPQHRSIYTFREGLAEHPASLCQTLPLFRIITPEVDLTVAADKYGVVDYPGLLRYWRESVLDTGTQIEYFPPGVIDGIKVIDAPDEVIVLLDGATERFAVAIDCTGVHANILRQVDSRRERENPLMEYVFGGVYRGNINPEALVLVFSNTAGGISWTNPSILGEEFIDVVFSAWGWKRDFDRFLEEGQERLKLLVQFLMSRQGISFEDLEPNELFWGMIRSQPAPRPQTHRIYAVGEAAGMAKPQSGQSFDRAILGGAMASEALEHNCTPAQFHRQWNTVWKGSPFFFAIALARLREQRANKVGGLVSKLDKWFSSEAGDSWLKDAGERFVVDNSLDWRLLIKFISDPDFLLYLARVNLLRLKMLVKREEPLKPFWPLPDLEK